MESKFDGGNNVQTHGCERASVFPYFATQVDSGAAVCSLFVQSVAGSDEVTDISDVDAHLQ